tara:strand:+ start:441 stop:674 length:234 start_codon:yes stop_codon:yes gene_type:complete
MWSLIATLALGAYLSNTVLSRSSCLLERGLLIISRRKLRNDGNSNRKLLLSLILIGSWFTPSFIQACVSVPVNEIMG